MRVLRSGVDLQHLFHLLARERGLRQHAPHRFLDHALGTLLEHVLDRGEAFVAHVTRVPEVALLLELAPRELHAGGVHHHDAVAAVQVRGEGGLVLAAQDLRHPARQPAERLARRVHHEPAARHVLFSQTERLHSRPSKEARSVTAANYTRAVRACQPEGSGLARVTSDAPFSTGCPTATCTVWTVPERGARSSFSIFIASTTTSPAPASTCWPSATSIRTTRPGIGARTVPSAARWSCSLAGSRPRDRSSCTATSTRSPTIPNAHRPASSSGSPAAVHDSPASSR